VNKFSQRSVLPQISFNRLSHYHNRGCLCGGATPPRARSAEKSLQQHSLRISPSPTVKLIKTIASHSLDAFPGLIGAQGWQIPDIFPKKPGCIFPIRNPLYFSAIFSFQAIPAFRMTN
jgi:hypothetical protein